MLFWLVLTWRGTTPLSLLADLSNLGFRYIQLRLVFKAWSIFMLFPCSGWQKDYKGYTECFSNWLKPATSNPEKTTGRSDLTAALKFARHQPWLRCPHLQKLNEIGPVGPALRPAEWASAMWNFWQLQRPRYRHHGAVAGLLSVAFLAGRWAKGGRPTNQRYRKWLTWTLTWNKNSVLRHEPTSSRIGGARRMLGSFQLC